MSSKSLFFSLLLSYNLNAQINEVDSTLIKNSRQAFLFSLVPGGGQFYNQKYIKGSLVMGLETLAFYSWLENSKIYKNYDSDIYSLRKNRYLEKRNKYAWWVIFLYFYSMIDAMVDAHLSPFDDIMSTSIDDVGGEDNEK
ncbi:DUF5683 domain-containing protein [Candidatus Marinimicrobia bacterium]|nr:DUF5683 domain-containing protein [Candidatus Neomarinimicrobiota bacterium]|tara:strand:+ start:35 stop:454 length:420 start_codon:yes stop_codon:yes gene_type:complete